MARSHGIASSSLQSPYFRSFKIVTEYYVFLLLLGLLSKRVSAAVLNLGNTIPILAVIIFFCAFAKLRKATITTIVSVCPSEWNTWLPREKFS